MTKDLLTDDFDGKQRFFDGEAKFEPVLDVDIPCILLYKDIKQPRSQQESV